MANKRWLLLAALAILVTVPLVWLFRPTPKAPPAVRIPPQLRIERSLVEERDGKLRVKQSGELFSGVMFESFLPDKPRSEVTVKEGIVDGPAKGWHENGQLEVEEFFSNGLSQGVRTRWYDNGQKRSQATIDKGVLEGPFTEWHQNGAMALRMNLVAGLGEGLCEAWYPDGRPKSRVMLKAGEPVESQFFPDDEPSPPGP